MEGEADAIKHVKFLSDQDQKEKESNWGFSLAKHWDEGDMEKTQLPRQALNNTLLR